MRSFRKQIRTAILAALPAASIACQSPGTDVGSTTAGASSATMAGGVTTSATTATGGDGTSTGAASTGTSNTGTSNTGTTGQCGCNPGTQEVVTAPLDGGTADGTSLPLGLCLSVCPGGLVFTNACSALPSDAFPDAGPAWAVTCDFCAGCTGRRPEGLQLPEPAMTSALGAYFSQMAHLEAASVPAFRRLAAELRSFGAPASLVRAAGRAARDEVRHARVMSRLARRHGARVPCARHAGFPARGLEAFAAENAVEGCVRETYGAALALAQAKTAQDPEVRAAMSRIAEDELSHAALAWSVSAWLETQLSPAAARRVRAGRRAAAKELCKAVSRPPSIEVAQTLGLPDAATALAMAESLGRALGWVAVA